MKHFTKYRRACRVVCIATATICTIVPATFAYAAPPPGAAAQMQAASDFRALMAASETKHEMPRLSDPAVAAALRTLSDVNGTLGVQRYTKDDIGTLLDVCGKANEVMVKYALHGAESLRDAAKGDQAALVAKVAALGNANVVKYQDEIAPLIAFGTECSARTIPAMTDFVASLPPEQMTPVRKSGIAQTRNGVYATVAGALMTANAAEFRPANRRQIVAAVAKNANVLAAFLPIAYRAQIVQIATGMMASATDGIKPAVTKISEAMTSAECTGLCAI